MHPSTTAPSNKIDAVINSKEGTGIISVFTNFFNKTAKAAPQPTPEERAAATKKRIQAQIINNR